MDGEDPSADLLTQLQKTWPSIKPGSKVSGNRVQQINLKDLRYFDYEDAELLVSICNGIDGIVNRYMLRAKNGIRVIEQIRIEAIS